MTEDFILCFLSKNKVWLIPLFSALLGSIVGGLATYYANKRHAKNLEAKERLNLAKALEAELFMLWERYMAIIGDDVEKSNDEIPVLVGILSTNQNYFVVFDNNANKLGLFEQELAKEIIKAYMHGKALFDELINYGKAVRQHKENLEHLKALFLVLKKRHFEVKKIIEEVVEKLKETHKLC